MVQEQRPVSTPTGDVPFPETLLISSKDLRRQLRERRRSLGSRAQRRNSASAARRLGCLPIFLRSRCVATYWASDGEIDPAPLGELRRSRRKHWFLPVLRPHPQRKLWFVCRTAGDRLVRNRYGIPEPSLRQHRIALPWDLDAILVPLVGFDSACRRLGMGGGFYDRTLGFLRHRTHWRRPTLIGLAHECQRVAELEAQPWDVPLDMVITEKRVYVRRSPGIEAPED